MAATNKFKVFSPDDTSKADPVTVGDVVNRYLKEKAAEVGDGTYSARSLEKLTHYLLSFEAMYGSKAVDDCQRADLTTWLRGHPEWKSTFTKQDAAGCVVACFNWAEEEFSIVSRYRRPKKLGPPVQPRPAIVPLECKAIRLQSRFALTPLGYACRTARPFRLALWFLWRTGCRTCEMREAEWSDVDWIRGVIRLKKHKTAGSTKDCRLIPIRSVLRLLVCLDRRKRPGQKKIFVNSQGKPWTCSRFAKEFRRFASRAGVRGDVSAYCLRHGMCVRLLDRGTGERQIADVLGHTTTRYVHWYGKSAMQNADYLNNVVRPRPRGEKDPT